MENREQTLNEWVKKGILSPEDRQALLLIPNLTIYGKKC